MTTLRALTPKEVWQQWGWVRNGLYDCVDKTGEKYLPEDVYHDVRSGRSWLFAIEHGGDDVGFTVLQRNDEPSGPILFVFAMWTEPGAGVAIEASINAALDNKAREVGASVVRMQSTRPGWRKNPNWVAKATIFEREVVL